MRARARCEPSVSAAVRPHAHSPCRLAPRRRAEGRGPEPLLGAQGSTPALRLTYPGRAPTGHPPTRGGGQTRTPCRLRAGRAREMARGVRPRGSQVQRACPCLLPQVVARGSPVRGGGRLGRRAAERRRLLPGWQSGTRAGNRGPWGVGGSRRGVRTDAGEPSRAAMPRGRCRRSPFPALRAAAFPACPWHCDGWAPAAPRLAGCG